MSDTEADIHAELAALADGTLPAERRAAALERVEASPELGGELDAQRRALAFVRSARVDAPPSLQQCVADLAERKRRPSPHSRGVARARRGRAGGGRAALAGSLALAAVAIAALILALGSSAPGAPTVVQTAKLALRPATQPSPAESTSNHGLLASSVEGIPYPYWEQRFGWRTAGARTDRIAGHAVTTVFYTNARAGRIGYSIVAGGALARPRGGRSVLWDGTRFQVVDADGAAVVTWRRAGHTCVLTGPGVSTGTLLTLASWQAT